MTPSALENPQPPALSQNLLLCLAEQLKLPLEQLARQAELAQLTGEYDAAGAQVVADAALKLIDYYTLGVRLAAVPDQFVAAEPLALSSVLYDSAVELQPMARAYGVDIDLMIDGKFGPVSGNRQALQAALVSLGFSLIEALPAAGASQLKLALSAHRCRYGLVAGIYSTNPGLSQQVLRQGRRLHGQARQPLPQLSASSGAGIFVADSILQSTGSHLFSSRHRNLRGLGTVLPLNPQLQLV